MNTYFTFIFALIISSPFFNNNIAASDPPKPRNNNNNFNPIKGISKIYSSVFGPQRPPEWKVSPDNSSNFLDDGSSHTDPITASAKSRVSPQSSPQTIRSRFFSISDSSSKKVAIGDPYYLSQGINEEYSLEECADIQSLKASLETASLEGNNSYVIYLFMNYPELRTIESDVIYKAIDSHDIGTLRTVLEYRGIIDFKTSKLGPLRYAIKKDFSDFIDILLEPSGIIKDDLLDYDEKYVSELMRKSTRAIMDKAKNSFTFLLEKIKSLGRIHLITLKSIIFNAIQAEDLFALESVLNATDNYRIENFTNANGLNPIHSASMFDFVAGLDLLIKHFGAESLNHKDIYGNTPCVLAVESEAVDSLNLILKHNPQSCLIPNDKSQTPLKHAKKHNHEIYSLLNQKLKISVHPTHH